jgi:hypothetical protein
MTEMPISLSSALYTEASVICFVWSHSRTQSGRGQSDTHIGDRNRNAPVNPQYRPHSHTRSAVSRYGVSYCLITCSPTSEPDPVMMTLQRRSLRHLLTMRGLSHKNRLNPRMVIFSALS